MLSGVAGLSIFAASGISGVVSSAIIRSGSFQGFRGFRAGYQGSRPKNQAAPAVRCA
jgi:hypothetical protein